MASIQDELEEAGSEFAEAPVRKIAPSKDGALAFIERTSASLLDLVASFSGDKKLHRIAVWDVDEDGSQRIVAIVSQSDVIALMHRHVADLQLGSVPVADVVPLAPDSVLTVAGTVTAIEAFELMAHNQRSAVGITAEPGGALIANLSASDMRNLGAPSSWAALALPVAQFVVQTNGITGLPPPTLNDVPGVPRVYAGSVIDGDAKYVALVTVNTEDSSLETVLCAMVENCVHHVYVVDHGIGRPQGVVTPFDILRWVSES